MLSLTAKICDDMDSRGVTQSLSSRAPLGDSTEHIINTSVHNGDKITQSQINAAINPLRAHPMSNAARQCAPPQLSNMVPTSAVPPANKRDSIGSKNDQDAEKRVSQVSNSSGASSSKRKTHIGPWQLGKTLGKGSAGRVRLARHYATQEQVAVKILPKYGCHVTQAGSLADIDKWDRTQPEFAADKRMPLSIEREVAILKLIDHPNIMKLWDIWENRSEIYLVLEYVEQGDLFGYINACGAIPEDETVYYFRQIISALDYCHSFSICHRDLKPENILLSSNGQIKIADFGMAAIQQSPKHRLKTACGSPHYAAPELVGRKGQGYRGDTVDVWSVGIILYACLCARLPFDDQDMPKLLAKAKRGLYHEPEELSEGSRNLIRKILNPEPEKRITIQQIWKHDFIVQYDYMDDLNGMRHDDNLDDIRKYGRNTRLAAEDIDMQTLRQLKSMWHMYTEKELALKLINDEPNDQKLFYWLLFNYREKRLENYVGDITHSPSDYHHLRPANWTKKFTTLEFPSRYGRTPSRFTVISNVATAEDGIETATDGGTMQSYDPYKSSQVMGDHEASHAKITVHRNGSLANGSTRNTNIQRMRSGSIKSSSTYSRREGRGRHIALPTGMRTSRRSLTSTRSVDGTPYKRPTTRHKRGVDFSRVRKRSLGKQPPPAYRSPASIARDDTTYGRDLMSPTSPNRRPRLSRGQNGPRNWDGTQSMINVYKTKDTQFLWNDELRQFSHSIAKDCDQAFNSSILTPDSNQGESTFDPTTMDYSSTMNLKHDAMSASVSMATPTPTNNYAKGTGYSSRLWDTRPLPPTPPTTDSVLHEIMLAKKRNSQRVGESDEPPGHVNRRMTRLEGVAPPVESRRKDHDLRVSSAPIYSQYSTQWGKDIIPLPSIFEVRRETPVGEQDKQRVVSAPTGETPLAQSTPRRFAEGKKLEYLACHENTIRMVVSPSDQQNPVRVPAPLKVRKKLSRGPTAYPQARNEVNLRQKYVKDAISETIPEDTPATSQQSASSPRRRRSSWFKRASKEKNDVFTWKGGSSSSHLEEGSFTNSNVSTAPPIPPTKRKSFNFAFWRHNKDQTQMKLSLADVDLDESPSPDPVRMFSHPARPPHNGQWKDNVSTRNIEPQQNWLARLFRVKPATEHLCFAIPRRRARQEIAILLREWRRYGIRDVQVDKDRNLVFGRVGYKNHLNMKEVSFAAEIMTVVEHGKRNPLSIVRFTQERGAASSFHKVIDTMRVVFGARNLIVTDKRKIKMMVKTLNS